MDIGMMKRRVWLAGGCRGPVRSLVGSAALVEPHSTLSTKCQLSRRLQLLVQRLSVGERLSPGVSWGQLGPLVPLTGPEAQALAPDWGTSQWPLGA